MPPRRKQKLVFGIIHKKDQPTVPPSRLQGVVDELRKREQAANASKTNVNTNAVFSYHEGRAEAYGCAARLLENALRVLTTPTRKKRSRRCLAENIVDKIIADLAIRLVHLNLRGADGKVYTAVRAGWLKLVEETLQRAREQETCDVCGSPAYVLPRKHYQCYEWHRRRGAKTEREKCEEKGGRGHKLIETSRTKTHVYYSCRDCDYLENRCVEDAL